MKDEATILRENQEQLAKIAGKIINDNRLTADQFYDEAVIGRPIYDQLIEFVRPAVERMTPRRLGEIAACGQGRAANRLGTPASNLDVDGTTLAETHAYSKFWLDPNDDGLSLMREIAASAIAAEICDQIGLDAKRFLTGTSRREAPAFD